MRQFKTLEPIAEFPAGTISVHASNERGVIFQNPHDQRCTLDKSLVIPLVIVEKFGDFFKEITETPKPPLGIYPAKLFYEQRLKDLNDALKRNCCAEHHVRVKWQREIKLIENVLLGILEIL